jgi:UDP-glucose 4-epimerase
VIECVKAFETVTGISLPIKRAPRRDGDLPIYYAKSDLAEKKLGWSARRSLEDMCKSAWHFQESRDIKK